ncbi:MAG: SH3 domain-containing protein [Anaerolineales bacterium]
MTSISLAACFFLAACTTAATVTSAPAASPPAPTVLPLPAQPSATATSLTAATATSAPTAAVTATPPPTAPVSTQSIAQAIPAINVYCRKGPGTDYAVVTSLSAGTTYNVVGRSSLTTWVLIQAPGNLTCWTGAQGASLQGPVAQVPNVVVAPVLQAPASFVGGYTCNTSTSPHTLSVSLYWAVVPNATGYRLYLNGTLLATLGPKVTSYLTSAPLGQALMYSLEGYIFTSISPRAVVNVPACN